MADEPFDGVAVGVAVQSGFGSPDTTLRDLAAGDADALADGLVLGDAESGDAESGVSIPSLVAIRRAVPAVAGSMTQSADKFQKLDVTGFSIAWVMQGNGGVEGSPTAGNCNYSTLIPGLDAILQSAGLVEANGAAPIVTYKPIASAPFLIYSTWKIWHGALAMAFTDCLVETLTFECTPGGNVIATADVLVGAYDPVNYFEKDLAFPTIDYDVMASLAGPTVEGVAFTAFAQSRGFENLSIAINTELARFGDSNVATTGERISMTKRTIGVTGTLYGLLDNTEAAHANLIDTSAPTEDLSFQVGAVNDGDPDVNNAFKFEVNNLQVNDIKYGKTGDASSVEISDSKATGTTAGTEFTLTLN
jgi:hypothetical protein